MQHPTCHHCNQRAVWALRAYDQAKVTFLCSDGLTESLAGIRRGVKMTLVGLPEERCDD